MREDLADVIAGLLVLIGIGLFLWTDYLIYQKIPIVGLGLASLFSFFLAIGLRRNR